MAGAIGLANPRGATGRGESGWKTLTYAQLSDAYDRGVALQPQFGRINTDDPDLTAFKKRGGKIISWHGFSDELIPAAGTMNYYNRVAAKMGGVESAQEVYRLYLAPGLGPTAARTPSPRPSATARRSWSRPWR